jgi:hypothetical protein
MYAFGKVTWRWWLDELDSKIEASEVHYQGIIARLVESHNARVRDATGSVGVSKRLVARWGANVGYAVRGSLCVHGVELSQ